MGQFKRRRKNTSDKGSGSHCAEDQSLPILITGLFTNTFTDMWISKLPGWATCPNYCGFQISQHEGLQTLTTS